MDTNGLFDLISILLGSPVVQASAGPPCPQVKPDSQPRREYSEVNKISICVNTMSISILPILIFLRLRLSICLRS